MQKGRGVRALLRPIKEKLLPSDPKNEIQAFPLDFSPGGDMTF